MARSPIMPPSAPSTPRADRPRLLLLGACAQLLPLPLPFADERRFRLAAVLALHGDWMHRDALAALFWPDRPQSAARSNLRKLLMELRALALPGLESGPAGLRWCVDSDAGDLLRLHHDGEHAAVAGMAFAAPLQPLSGGDSVEFEDWLGVQRERLLRAWRASLLHQGERLLSADAAQALALAQRLLEIDPQDNEASRLAVVAAQAPASADTSGERGDPEALIGRTDEAREGLAMLQEPGCCVLTLTGPGGVGKSALALALFRDAAAADGAHWVALEDLVDVAQVLPRAARELGLSLPAGSDGLAEVAARLRGRRELLVLDNAEHLGGLSACLARLLDAAPGLRCLVTSRVPLSLPGEWLLPVGPLAPAAAARLFVRAARAAPSRTLLGDDDAAVAEIAQRLGRLPLALCLAAAWTRHLTLPVLLEELQAAPARPLELLELAHSIDEHPAHASLRATFERSWQFLPPALRPVLAALSVCVGTAPLQVAEQLAEQGAAAGAPALLALAESSLLQLGADGRVSMHPLVRQFAAGKLALDAAAARAAADRHAAVFASFVGRWKEHAGVGNAQALAAITPELSNLLVAWDHAVKTGLPRVLEDLAAVLELHYEAHGALAEVLPRFARAEQILARAEPVDLPALARVALEHAGLNFWLADHAAVERSAWLALRAARAGRLGPLARQALNVLALAALRTGRAELGAQRLSRALSRARADGAAQEAVIYAGNLCGVLIELGELERAEALALQTLAEHRQLTNSVGEASMLNELGRIAHQRGGLDAAFDWHEQALAVIDRHAMAMRRPVALTHQASVRLEQNRAADALALAEQSLAEVQRAGLKSHEPTLRRVMAETLLALGRGDDAREQLRLALAQLPDLDASPAVRGFLCSAMLAALWRGDAERGAWLALWISQHQAPRAALLPRHARALQAALTALAALGPAREAVLRAEVAALPASALRQRLLDAL